MGQFLRAEDRPWVGVGLARPSTSGRTSWVKPSGRHWTASTRAPTPRPRALFPAWDRFANREAPARFFRGFRGFGLPARALAFGRAMFEFRGASWNSSGVRACRRADCDLGPPAADMVSRWCLAAAARHVSPATALFPAL